MVSFGRRNNKLDTLSNPSKYASTPLDVPGDLYTKRRPDEVDADGDLDDLIQQEIQRYEELFHSSNTDLQAAPGDDDTLQDGSIYTSLQLSSAMFATMHRSTPQDEEETMWGLDNAPMQQPPLKNAQTSLLNPEEAAAALACNVTKPKPGKTPFVPPVPVLSVDEPAPKVKAAVTTPMQCKKNKFKPSFRIRFLVKASGRSFSNKADPSTPRTHASTPAASNATKMKLFPPVKFLKPSKSSKKDRRPQPPKQSHQNLLLASRSTGAANQNEARRGPSPAVQRPESTQCRTPPPPPTTSPPPPIQEIINLDGDSVVSTHSSLTEAPDTWIDNSKPPSIIGGNHVQGESPYKNEGAYNMEAYEGGLTPYLGTTGNPAIEIEDDEVSAISPGALLLTEEGLFFHNHHGSALSPIRADEQDTSDLCVHDSLVQLVWANKEQQERRRESKNLELADINPEDADMQVIQILGLKAGETEQSNAVKRDLFGAGNDLDANLDVSLAPLEQVACVAEEEQDDKALLPVATEYQDQVEEKAEDECQPQQLKASKFKRFLNKLVNNPKMKQMEQEAQAQRWKEQERLKAYEAQKERQRLEEEETKRIEQMRQQELERQRMLELGSQNPPSNTSTTESATQENSSIEDGRRPSARSFSLMTGQMKLIMDQPTSQSSFTADLTAFPTLQTSPSSLGPSFSENPRSPPSPENELLLNMTPNSSSYLVNFQFNRQFGEHSFTMAYAVDASASDGILWKDIVNEAWKQDRRLVKSGVFSAIQAENIKKKIGRAHV